MNKVSVIIPVYNTSKYLDKCIDSLVNQTLDDIEFIMVNDGSTDNSKEIIEKWVKKDKRIKLYNKENGGQASARNLGLTKAEGEYIAFLDSDDYISYDMYETLYNEANKYDLDIVLCDYYLDYGDKVVENKKLFVQEGDVSCKDYIMSTPSPVNKIIKRSFLEKNKFKFPEGFIYEDLASMPILGIYEPKIKYINKYLYYYVQTPVSTMRNDEYKKKYEDLFTAIEYLYNNIHGNEYDLELEYVLTYHFLYAGSLNFYKYKKYDKINMISKKMKNYFPKWNNNKYVKENFSRGQIIYLNLFYLKKYKLINLYRMVFRRNEYKRKNY